MLLLGMKQGSSYQSLREMSSLRSEWREQEEEVKVVVEEAEREVGGGRRGNGGRKMERWGRRGKAQAGNEEQHWKGTGRKILEKEEEDDSRGWVANGEAKV